MEAADTSGPSLGSQVFPLLETTNELATDTFLRSKTSIARVAHIASLAAAWLVIIPVFSPVIAMAWLAITLHNLIGRALSDRSLTSLPHIESDVEAPDEAQASMTPEQKGWRAEMEYFDRF